MRTGIIKQIRLEAATLAAMAVLCLSPGLARSADSAPRLPVLAYGASSALSGQRVKPGSPGQRQIHPGTPMVLDPVTGAFEFDLNGSETRKLELQLANPIMLEMGHHLLSASPGSNFLGLDATLRIPLDGGLSLHGGAKQMRGNTQFQTLGSIQCLNGTLGPDSYTASGCRFVTDKNPIFDSRSLNLGVTHEFGNVSTSLNWFTSDTKRGVEGVYKLNQIDSATVFENPLLAPFSAERALPGTSSASYIVGETTGIDLNFELGFTTDQAGDIRLGLALTRVLNANYQGIYGRNLSPLDWSIANPFDSAALGIEWSRGSFSSGIRGYYREPMRFLNRESLDSTSTFDVHFTWRAPWNANLSVGTSNVLGAGVDDTNGLDKPTDRFESIYGRIPYVRYQQDL